MRDKLQALLKQWKRASSACCENYEGKMLDACIKDFESILTTKPQVVSVKSGWVCKDRVGLWWCEHEPEHLADGKWITTGSLYLSKRVFTDPWPDKPNGGPECLMEVK